MKKIIISLLSALTCVGIGLTTVNADTVNNTNQTQQTSDISNQYDYNVSNTIPINATTFDYFVKSGQTAIVYVGYAECPSCQQFAPTLHRFINQTGTPVFYLNLDNLGYESQDFINEMKQFQVNETPTVLLLKHGHVVQKYVGSTITNQQLRTLAWLAW